MAPEERLATVPTLPPFVIAAAIGVAALVRILTSLKDRQRGWVESVTFRSLPSWAHKRVPWSLHFWANLAIVVTAAAATALSFASSPSSSGPEFTFRTPSGWTEGGAEKIVDGARILDGDEAAARDAMKGTFVATRKIAEGETAFLEGRVSKGTLVATEARIREAAEASRDGLAKVGGVSSEIRDVEIVRVGDIASGRFRLRAEFQGFEVTTVTYVVPGRSSRATIALTAATPRLDDLLPDFEAFVAAAPQTTPPAFLLPFNPVYLPLAALGLEILLEFALAKVPPSSAAPKKKRKRKARRAEVA